MRQISYREAIREALAEEMARDEQVVLMGEDVGCYGGCFSVTSGLIDIYGPHQVIETPVSEEGIVAVAVGAAIMGMRPVVEVMYGDFSTLASDPLINHAAKTRFMSGGRQSVPMVYRTPMGSGTGAAAQHTQSLETLFTNIPGLKVIYPCTPSDAKGLLKSAIRCDDPVVFLEHKNYGLSSLIPEEDYTIEIGKADVKRKGTDLTIITYGKMVSQALSAALTLEDDEISAEVVDLRTLRPLDTEAIRASVKKTGRAVILHEGPAFGGFSGEIAAAIVEDEDTFRALKGPVKRIGGQEIPTPFNKNLEMQMAPQVSQIISVSLSLFS